MSAWEHALSHLEVVQGLPGQGLPPELDEEHQQQQGRRQDTAGEDAQRARDVAASAREPAPADQSTPPPTPPQGHPSPPGAAKAAPGAGAKPEKNPTQELVEFYNRFKGQRIASFDRPGDPEDLKRPWICTIHLSGGRINDKQCLGEYTFEGQDRTKKGSEAAASRAAMDHLRSLGIANSETLTSQSNKQERWILPKRRLPDSTLVCLELSAGAQAGDLMPTGQIVVELFHDVAPKTLANLRHAFGLGSGPPTHTPSQSQAPQHAASTHTHSTLESHPVHLDEVPGPGASSNSAHSSSQSGNSSNGIHSSHSVTVSNGHSAPASAANAAQNGSSVRATTSTTNSSSTAQSCGYIGCKVAHPLSNYRVSFTPPTRISAQPTPPQSPPAPSATPSPAAGAAGGEGSQPQSGDTAAGGKAAGSGSRGESAPGGSAMPEKPAQDALASLLDMQEDMLGIAEGDEESEVDQQDERDPQDDVGAIEQQQEEAQWAQQLQEQQQEMQQEEKQQQQDKKQQEEKRQQQQQQETEKEQQQQEEERRKLSGAAIPLKLQYLPLHHCWPSDWLARDFPTARLITVEYLAPISGWEGESLPLEDTVERIMVQLAAAGVGQRPLVFVAHSMGGLLVKEILARSLLQEQHPPSAARAAVATAPDIEPASFAALPPAHDTHHDVAAPPPPPPPTPTTAHANAPHAHEGQPTPPTATPAAHAGRTAQAGAQFEGVVHTAHPHGQQPHGQPAAAGTAAAGTEAGGADNGRGRHRAEGGARHSSSSSSNSGGGGGGGGPTSNSAAQWGSGSVGAGVWQQAQHGHERESLNEGMDSGDRSSNGSVSGAVSRDDLHASRDRVHGRSKGHTRSNSSGGSHSSENSMGDDGTQGGHSDSALPAQAPQPPGPQTLTVSSSLSRVTCGIVFFGTPHFGSDVAAMGWRLRHVPYAAPAPSLARLTPGPHLIALNQALAGLHAEGRIAVISAVEGERTQLSPMLPKWHVVPEASAYPGFGEKLLLPGQDHISCCKPASQHAPSYEAVASMLRRALHLARQHKQAPQ